MEYTRAIKIATRLLELFAPHCIVVDIAGSIRREHRIVKDIEILCLPKTHFVQTDLFGGGHHTQVPEFTQAVQKITSRIVKGKYDGRYMQLHIKGGGLLDLFMPQRSDYYRQLAIRTGSADYAHHILAVGWQKKGWCGTPDGLRKIEECTASSSGWKCITSPPSLPPEWRSEQEFFEWLGLKWIAPKFRELKK